MTRLYASIQIGLQLGCCEPLHLVPWRSTTWCRCNPAAVGGRGTKAAEPASSALLVLSLHAGATCTTATAGWQHTLCPKCQPLFSAADCCCRGTGMCLRRQRSLRTRDCVRMGRTLVAAACRTELCAICTSCNLAEPWGLDPILI